MTKKTAWIIGLQALLIIALFWVLVFYGKDEFEDYLQDQDEEIESINRVTEKQGISTVTVPMAAQRNSGIKTAKVTVTQVNAEVKSVGSVVSLDSLIDAKTQIANLHAEANLARSVSSQNIAQYQRLKVLNTDDKNVSDKVVQEALNAVNADKARVNTADLQIKNLQNALQLKWGNDLAKLLGNAALPPYLAKLLNRQNVLVQVSLPSNSAQPAANSTVQISPINEALAITAVYVSPASQTDASGLGKTYYYSAPAEQLRVGMRINVALKPSSNASQGVVIPNSAVVWHAGTAWVYVKQGSAQFNRKPIQTTTEIDNGLVAGWFNQTISDNSEVVIAGAQLLLSEEFKYQIKNENED